MPDAVWDQTNLETLVLADNDPAEISDRVGDLRRENAFDVLPEAVTGMSDLLELRVTDNRLTGLPASIARLVRLRELHLRNNTG